MDHSLVLASGSILSFACGAFLCKCNPFKNYKALLFYILFSTHYLSKTIEVIALLGTTRHIASKSKK